MPIKILVLGSSGRLGNAIYKSASSKRTFIIYSTGLKKRNFNLSTLESIKNLIIKTKPDVIINCIALTNIDLCEKLKKECKKINYFFVKKICYAIENLKSIKKIVLIHFSTDQFYDNINYITNNEKSKKLVAYNYYTKCKLMADNYLNKKNYCMILRTNFFGKSYKGNLLSDWVYKSIQKKKKIILLHDINFSPLRLDTLSKIITKILLGRKFFKGIYNLGSKGGISKSNFAKMISKTLKKKLFFEEKSSDNFFKVKRPKNMIMNVSKFEKKFEINLPNTKQEIKLEIKSNYERN